jgi:hypothetical protein
MQPILIRNFEGVASIEFKLSQYTPDDVLPAEIDSAVDAVSKVLFGITHRDTIFPVYEGDDPWRWSDEHFDHEDNFLSTDLDDLSTVEFLLGMDKPLDFRDERGHPMRCVMWLRRQAEAAARGFMGTMPDPGVAAEGKLEAEREAFLAARRKARPAA